MRKKWNPQYQKPLTALKNTFFSFYDLTFSPEIYQTIPSKHTHTEKNCNLHAKQCLFIVSFKKIYWDNYIVFNSTNKHQAN